MSSLSALSLISYPTEAKRVSTTEKRSRVWCLVFCVYPETETKTDVKLFVDVALRRNSNAPNARRETQTRAARLHCVFGAFVFGFTHAFFDGRIGDGDDRDRNQDQHGREQEPFGAVRRGGDPEVVFRDLPKG